MGDRQAEVQLVAQNARGYGEDGGNPDVDGGVHA